MTVARSSWAAPMNAIYFYLGRAWQRHFSRGGLPRRWHCLTDLRLPRETPLEVLAVGRLPSVRHTTPNYESTLVWSYFPVFGQEIPVL